MKVRTEERIYLAIYLGAAFFILLLLGYDSIVFSLMGGMIALFGFTMIIFTRMRQIIRILKKNNLWQEELLPKSSKDVKEKKDEL